MHLLISSLGDHLHDFFHGIPLIPKATVTSAKNRSSQMLSSTISAGWPKTHNFLDLGRNSTPIQLKLDTTPCHSYSHRLSNFGILKFRIKKVFFSKELHLFITFWLLSLENEHDHTFKPPWPNFTSSGILLHITNRAAHLAILKFRIQKVFSLILSHFGCPFLLYSLEAHHIQAFKPPWLSILSSEVSPQFYDHVVIFTVQIFRIRKASFSTVSHFHIILPLYILEFYHNYIVELSWYNMLLYGAAFQLRYRGNSHFHRNFQLFPLTILHHYRLHPYWHYSGLSITRICQHDIRFIARWQLEYPVLLSRPQLGKLYKRMVLMCEDEDFALGGKPVPRPTTLKHCQSHEQMPRSMAIKHRQLQDQLAKIQQHIDTTRTCLADTCQQLGVALSDYIHEE